MSRNTSGTFTLPSGNPVVTGTPISSVTHNATMADIAAEITDSLSRSGKGAMLSALKLVSGSAAAPGLTFDGDTNVGLYRPAANEMAIVVGGQVQAIFSHSKQPMGGFSPLGDGAVGDGVTDDSNAIQAAIIKANAVSALFTGLVPGGGVRVAVDLQGRQYGITETLPISGDGVILQNGGLKVLSTLGATDYAITITGEHSGVERVALDCGILCRGIDVEGYHNHVQDTTVYHFKTYGILLGDTEARASYCNVFQWHFSDAQFTNAANYTAVGIYVDSADVVIDTCVVRYCGKCIGSSADAGVTQIVDCHLYNGGAGLWTPTDPILLEWHADAGYLSVENTYFDNGVIDLYSFNVTFLGCAVNRNITGTPPRVSTTRFINLYANGEPAPTNFRSTEWQVFNDPLKDGTIPFYNFVDFGGDVWVADYDPLVNAEGRRYMEDKIVMAASFNDGFPNITYYSPGGVSDGKSAKLAFADANTDLTDWKLLPGIWSHGNSIFMYRPIERVLEITTDTTTDDTTSGRMVVLSGVTDRTLTLHADAKTGCYIPNISQRGGGQLTIDVEVDGTLVANGSIAPFTLPEQYSRCAARCIYNGDGAHAVWLLEDFPVADPAVSCYFMTYPDAAVHTNVTGNGAIYRVPFENEVEDDGNNFSLAEYNFTAPVDGVYSFQTSVYLTGASISGANSVIGYIWIGHGASNNSYALGSYQAPLAFKYQDSGNEQAWGHVATTIKMAAGEKVGVWIQVSNLASNMCDLSGGFTSNVASSWFSGVRVA